RFGILLMNKGKAGNRQVLSAKLVEEMLKKQAPGPNPDGAVGLGVFLSEDGGFGHGGSNIGFRCDSLFFAESGDGVVIMTNGDYGGMLIGEILRSVLAHYKF